MRFFTTFTIIMIAVLFIFLDIAKRNTAFLLYRVLLRVGLITFISIVGVKSRLLCKMLYNVFTISTYQN
ncbi:hypothetical protein OKY_02670 [Enterococcus faecium EnGen0048]|nr:hypothetical protein OKY_02670 [Enterococcus faecium EnGen0048]